MKIASVSSSNYSHQSTKKSAAPAFKMSAVTTYGGGISDFIKKTSADSKAVKAMFERIQCHLTKVKGDNLHFNLEHWMYPTPEVNIETFFTLTQKEKENLAYKYRKLLTRNEFEKLCSDDFCKGHYIAKDLEDPYKIFRMQSPRPHDKFNLKMNDDKTIARIVEETFPAETAEGKIFVSMIRRPHNVFKNIYRWLNTHGPDEPPIY